MKKLYDRTDEYYIFIVGKLLYIAPITGVSVGIVLTVAYLKGLFETVSIPSLVIFDLICLSYCLVAYRLHKMGIIDANGSVDKRRLMVIGIAIDIILVLQWNLISYLFPVRSFWGYAPMFVLLVSFLFQTKIVLAAIMGLSASIAISWLLNGDKLLPLHGDQYGENLVLRIVALGISFTVIYLLTFFAERFTKVAKENYVSMKTQNMELENMGRDIIDFTADIIEERDSSSGSHVKRLKVYTKILAEQIAKNYPEYGLTDEIIEEISLACVLHDVGKIGIPDNILLKPGRLTPEEFDVIKTHTVIGAKIIDKLPDSVGDDYKRFCKEICQFHHEKYDGKGYPIGLKGEDIPISAQIVSVVDCYDALISERPYKNALPKELAIKMILDGECGVFSDRIKKSLMECKDQMISN